MNKFELNNKNINSKQKEECLNVINENNAFFKAVEDLDYNKLKILLDLGYPKRLRDDGEIMFSSFLNEIELEDEDDKVGNFIYTTLSKKIMENEELLEFLAPYFMVRVHDFEVFKVVYFATSKNKKNIENYVNQLTGTIGLLFKKEYWSILNGILFNSSSEIFNSFFEIYKKNVPTKELNYRDGVNFLQSLIQPISLLDKTMLKKSDSWIKVFECYFDNMLDRNYYYGVKKYKKYTNEDSEIDLLNDLYLYFSNKKIIFNNNKDLKKSLDYILMQCDNYIGISNELLLDVYFLKRQLMKLEVKELSLNLEKNIFIQFRTKTKENKIKETNTLLLNKVNDVIREFNSNICLDFFKKIELSSDYYEELLASHQLESKLKTKDSTIDNKIILNKI